MLVAFSISPTAADETGGVSAAVAEAVRVVRESGLPCETNAMFTNIEGDRLPENMRARGAEWC